MSALFVVKTNVLGSCLFCNSIATLSFVSLLLSKKISSFDTNRARCVHLVPSRIGSSAAKKFHSTSAISEHFSVRIHLKTVRILLANKSVDLANYLPFCVVLNDHKFTNDQAKKEKNETIEWQNDGQVQTITINMNNVCNVHSKIVKALMYSPFHSIVLASVSIQSHLCIFIYHIWWFRCAQQRIYCTLGPPHKRHAHWPI